MARSIKKSSYRGRPGPLDWARTNPLFAIAAVMVLVVAGFVGSELVRNYVSPKRFVTVDFYGISQTAESHGVSISLHRVTYQPGIDMRLGSTTRRRDPPSVIIDGLITNNTQETLSAFLPVPGEDIGAVLTGIDQKRVHTPATILGKRKCAAISESVTLMPPGSERRLSALLPLDRGSDSNWVREELKKGLFAAISFGPFAFIDCLGDTKALDDLQTWRIEFSAADIQNPEALDYYPFGKPTVHAVGVEGRGYWSDWVPRLQR